MQWSTDIRQIRAAIFDQAFIGRTWVSCPMGRVVAIRQRKRQLFALIYGWGRFFPGWFVAKAAWEAMREAESQ
jgi:hypothetical protein